MVNQALLERFIREKGLSAELIEFQNEEGQLEENLRLEENIRRLKVLHSRTLFDNYGKKPKNPYLIFLQSHKYNSVIKPNLLTGGMRIISLGLSPFLLFGLLLFLQNEQSDFQSNPNRKYQLTELVNTKNILKSENSNQGKNKKSDDLYYPSPYDTNIPIGVPHNPQILIYQETESPMRQRL